jgi:N-acetylglucosamine kinase-like BadF-type ATPase
VAAVCAQADCTAADLGHAFFGLPGYGEVSADVPALDKILTQVLGHDRYHCDNDTVAGWAGSLGAADGVNVVAGTGSMTYGRHAGVGVRLGGWGELFDDEGSAYWIATQGLHLFARMADGRAPHGPLLDMLRRQLELATDLDLVDVVLNRWQGDRSRIADLARVVSEAAEDGDPGCARILAEAGRLLAELVVATLARLEFPATEAVPVSWSGSVFDSALVAASFCERLADEPVELRAPLLPPSVGAAVYAARLAGTPLTAAALERLRHHPARTPEGSRDD